MCQLKEPIGSPVGDSLVCSAQSILCFSAILAAFLFTCQFSVALGNFSHANLKELRTFNGSAVAASEELLESKIKASRMNGTCDLILSLFLLTTKHYPKTIHAISLERASFDIAFDLTRFNEFVLILTKTDSIFAKVCPTCLLERDASMPSGTLELGLASLQPSPRLDPLKKRLVRQVEFFNDRLDTLRSNDLPSFATIAKLGNVLHQLEFIAVLLEQSIVGFLKSNTVIANASGCSHKAMKPVILAALVHSEFVADSHLDVSLVFNILLNDRKRSTTHRCDEIAICPKRWHSTLEVPEF
jgi:hypothetical protein